MSKMDGLYLNSPVSLADLEQGKTFLYTSKERADGGLLDVLDRVIGRLPGETSYGGVET